MYHQEPVQHHQRHYYQGTNKEPCLCLAVHRLQAMSFAPVLVTNAHCEVCDNLSVNLTKGLCLKPHLKTVSTLLHMLDKVPSGCNQSSSCQVIGLSMDTL